MQEQIRKIWVLHENDYHLCKVISNKSYVYEVELPDGNILSTTEVYRANPPNFMDVNDLASLSHLNQPSVLSVLRSRYEQNKIYTHSGLFLVAINPYKDLDIYSTAQMNLYSRNDPNLPPHIYKTISEAYTNMILNKNNQSILITGESGAGKTENTKKAISFLLTLSEGNKSNSQNNFMLVEQIIKTNIILESFGNAMTIRNDNSSRFGKYIQLNFKSGNIVGCTIEKYLLEKSRVVQTSQSERNYHIFYQLLRCNDSDLLQRLHLTNDLSKYKILNNFTDLSDNLMFDQLIDAFNTLNFTKEEIFNYFKIVSVILNLGNVEFYEEESVKIRNMDVLNLACDLLNIPVYKFVKYILHPNKSAGREEITVIHSIKQCKMIIEGVIKILYDYLFENIINALNKKLNGNCNFDNFIAILDIAGFEIFPFNSFEQLSINYTNEKLQQFFNHHMFILEQEIYRKEEIDWNYIDFGLDLKPTIDTIDKVFSILEDQCLLINSSDASFLLSLKSGFKINNDKLSFNKIEDSCFNVLHYAGKVEYNTDDWLIKNYDPYFTEIINLLSLKINDNLTSKGFFRTVSQLYKNQLDLLMNKLKKTNPFFVRCIIPNSNKKRGIIDTMLVLKQLKCNGILEGIRISRLGYPNRMKYEEFVKRYKILLCKDKENSDALNVVQYANKNHHNELMLVNAILRKMNTKEEFYKLGKSMIFFKQDILGYFEEERDNIVNKTFNSLLHYIKGITKTLKQNKVSSRLKSIKIIQSNAKLSNEFRRWKWWHFYLKIKPLLKVHQMDDIIKMKEKEISYLNDSLKQKENDLLEIINEKNEIKNDLAIKQRENESINQLILEKEKEIKAKNDLIDLINEKDNENKSLINEFISKISDLEKERDHLQEIKEKINELNEINKINESKLKEKDELINENKKILIELQTELETNKKLSDNKTEELIKLKDKEISELKYEIQLIKEENKSNSEEINQKNTLIDELMKEKDENNKLIKKLKENNEVLMDDNNKHTSIIGENEYLISDLSTKLQMSIIDNELLAKEIERNNNKINDLEDKLALNDELELKNHKLKEEINALNIKINSLKDKNNALEEKIKKVESSNINELNIKINDLNKKILKERKLNKQLQSENTFLSEENKRLTSDRIKEIEEIREKYELRIKELDLKLLSHNYSLKEESESTDDNRLLILLEEEKSRINELERLLTEQENKNTELLSQLRSKEYELIDKVNLLEKKSNANKEKYMLLFSGINKYFNQVVQNKEEDHSNCQKKINLLSNNYNTEKEYLNDKINSLNKQLLTIQEELLDHLQEKKERELKEKENILLIKMKDNEINKLLNQLQSEVKEKDQLNQLYNNIINDVQSDRINLLEIKNVQLNRKVTELEKLVEFYKPFALLKK